MKRVLHIGARHGSMSKKSEREKFVAEESTEICEESRGDKVSDGELAELAQLAED